VKKENAVTPSGLGWGVRLRVALAALAAIFTQEHYFSSFSLSLLSRSVFHSYFFVYLFLHLLSFSLSLGLHYAFSWLLLFTTAVLSALGTTQNHTQKAKLSLLLN
jgi:hypothetical protein